MSHTVFYISHTNYHVMYLHMHHMLFIISVLIKCILDILYFRCYILWCILDTMLSLSLSLSLYIYIYTYIIHIDRHHSVC